MSTVIGRKDCPFFMLPCLALLKVWNKECPHTDQFQILNNLTQFT